jgi:hypothetical protein
MTVAATGLVVGYLASSVSGPAHLRYGLARDFLLPALLVAVVAVSLASAGGWLLLSRSGSLRVPGTGIRVSTAATFVVLAVVSSIALVSMVAVVRAEGLPRIESRQVGDIAYVATCDGGTCDVELHATTVSGRPISIPQRSTLTFGCGSDTPRFTRYVERPSAGVPIPESCRDPRLVAAWPTIMGLPPGSYELGFVRVANA